ncbi:hypothetical protein [Planomonospora algeriensis]
MAKRRGRSSRHRRAGRPVLSVALLTDELDFEALRAHGPLAHRDYQGYLAACERDLRALHTSGKVVAETFDLVEYIGFCQIAGLKTGDPASRARYATLVCEEGDPLPYRGEPIEEFVATLARRERLRRMSSRIEGMLTPVPAGTVLVARDRATDLFLWLLSGQGPGLHVLTCRVAPAGSEPLEVVAEAEVRSRKTLLYGDAPLVLTRLLVLACATGAPGSLVMRFFTRRTDSATGLPVKVVRGWTIEGGELRPLSGAEMRTAACTDHRTGAPLAPEPAVEHADAPSFPGAFSQGSR